MLCKIIQTCDPNNYFDMFVESSKTTREYSKNIGCQYEAFVGIKNGNYAWQATYNRIQLLDDIRTSGFKGWVVYLDADSFVADLRFDIYKFLNNYSDYSVLGASGGDESWNINAGILFLNYSKKFTFDLIKKWREQFVLQVGDEKLKNAPEPWSSEVKNDQELLHECFQSLSNFENNIKKIDFNIIGHPNSRFIRQVLRQAGDYQVRLKIIRDAANIVITKGV